MEERKINERGLCLQIWSCFMVVYVFQIVGIIEKHHSATSSDRGSNSRVNTERRKVGSRLRVALRLRCMLCCYIINYKFILIGTCVSSVCRYNVADRRLVMLGIREWLAGGCRERGGSTQGANFYFLLFFLFTWPRGGVNGRLALSDAIGNFFLSAGFNIWNEHISVSSTLIIAPALSNSPQ